MRPQISLSPLHFSALQFKVNQTKGASPNKIHLFQKSYNLNQYDKISSKTV